jgi:hypothetical protein
MATRAATSKAPLATPGDADFAAVFTALRALLLPYSGRFRVAQDTAAYFYLETTEAIYKRRPLMFAAVRAGKAYVSYHLMPLYMNPVMQKRLSPALKRRMQGKSCFNFTRVDEELFAELATLTKEGCKCFRKLAARIKADPTSLRR